MCRKLLLIFSLFFFSFVSFAQQIGNQRIINWNYAGNSEIEYPEIEFNVLDFGIDSSGTEDISQKLAELFKQVDEEGVIVNFPKGTYLIKNTIRIPENVVIRGEGAESTKLLADLPKSSSHVFNISNTCSGKDINIATDLIKGTKKIVVVDASSFSVDDIIEIEQDNSDWDIEPASWAKNAVGQLNQIERIEGNTLYLHYPININYYVQLNSVVRKIEPIEASGIENLSIERISNPDKGGGSNIYFYHAVNCFVKGVESNKSVGSHIMVNNSLKVKISGCYVHHAFNYDGSATQGYGVTLNHHATFCLVENNIFSNLRHAMMVKVGANSNVFAYNYSKDVVRSEFPFDASGDISLHGHYSYANLFEGNIVQNIIIDHYWGPSGPYNTFFRNKTLRYGVLLTESDFETCEQNFIGNDIQGKTLLHGQFYLTGSDHYLFANLVKGKLIPENTDELNDTSYFYKGKPDFWMEEISWPAIGVFSSPTDGNIPAYQRFKEGKFTFYALNDTSNDTSTNNTSIGKQTDFDKVKIFPNPCNEKLEISNVPGGCNQMVIYDAKGKQVEVLKNEKENTELITSQYISGIYLILFDFGKTKFSKEFIKL
jgi:hypothetical protein